MLSLPSHLLTYPPPLPLFSLFLLLYFKHRLFCCRIFSLFLFNFHLTSLIFRLHLSLSSKSTLCSYRPVFFLPSISPSSPFSLSSHFAVESHLPIPTLDWSQPLPPLMRGDWVLNWALQSQLGHTDWRYGLLEASQSAQRPRPAKVHFNHLPFVQQMGL